MRVWFEQFWWVLGGRLRGVEPLGFRLYIRVSFGAALQQIAVCKARGTRDRALQPSRYMCGAPSRKGSETAESCGYCIIIHDIVGCSSWLLLLKASTDTAGIPGLYVRLLRTDQGI